MMNVRRLWSRIGVAAFLGGAAVAGTAFAYEQTADAQRASLLLVADQSDHPGIDYIITGPVGPSKKAQAGSDRSTSTDPVRPLRHRMRLE